MTVGVLLLVLMLGGSLFLGLRLVRTRGRNRRGFVSVHPAHRAWLRSLHLTEPEHFLDREALIVSGHPGVQSSRVLARAFDDVMARTATLVKAALDGATPRFRGERPAHARAGTAAIAWFWLKSMSFAVLSLSYRLFYNTPHWRIGYRFVQSRDVVDLRAHPAGGWRVLPDNGLRFYSDPFPVEKDGRKVDKIGITALDVTYKMDPDAKSPLKAVKSDLKIESSKGEMLFDRELGAVIERHDVNRIKGTIDFKANDQDVPGKLDLTYETGMTREKGK